MVIHKILIIIFSPHFVKMGKLVVLKIKKRLVKHILYCKIASNSTKAASTRTRFCLKIEIFFLPFKTRIHTLHFWIAFARPHENATVTENGIVFDGSMRDYWSPTPWRNYSRPQSRGVETKDTLVRSKLSQVDLETRMWREWEWRSNLGQCSFLLTAALLKVLLQ